MSRCVSVLLAFVAWLMIHAASLRADEEPPPVSPWREVAVGGMATPSGWALYSASTIAPFGDLDGDGFRLRLASGYGKYHYDTLPAARGDCRYGFGDGRKQRIDGRASFAEVLAGYQTTLASTTFKGFAGVAMDTQELTPLDICNRTAGRDVGFKVAAETWTELSPALWLAFDGGWSAAHATYSARARLGYRVLPKLSLGLEQAVVGNSGGDQLRSGLFARHDWSGGEVSVSGGIVGDHFAFKAASKDDTWAAVSVLFRY